MSCVETREVLADAYRRGWRTGEPMLTHAVEVDAEGREIGVLGGRCVRLDSIADRHSNPPGLDKAPTCPRCLPHWQSHRAAACGSKETT